MDPPPPHVDLPRGERFWDWFVDGYLKGIIGISILGGQITFTVLVSDIADPAEIVRSPTFPKETVRNFIGISWLLFVVLLGISVFLAILLADRRERDWLLRTLGPRRFRSVYSAVTFFLNILSVAPFLFLALAITAYLPVVGWIGTAFVSILTVVVGVTWRVLDCM